MVYKFWIILLSVFSAFVCGEETVLPLKGYLGKEEVAVALKSLNKPVEKLLLEINSSSGDLEAVFEMAKRIYALKVENKTQVVVYIEENALGPAALLPFLTDELYISLLVAWGDIPAGSDAVTPNILRSQVLSLIPESSRADKLRNLAEKMAVGEVFNQNDLKEFIKESLSLEKFQEIFHLKPVDPIPQENKEAPHITFQSGNNTVGLITIDDRTSGISQSTWIYVKNALDYYKKTKPAFLILELNTPGGEVYAAQRISDALKELDTQYNIPVVAFINNWAISAGAMLAYSTRYIAIVKDSSMGAAEPLSVEGGKTEVASEKVNSALRADFANRAAFFGRNPFIAEAMVDKDIILVKRHGRIIKVDSEDQIKKKGPDADIIFKPKGKLLTLNSEQLLQEGVADIYLPPQKLPQITEKELEKGKWEANKMLLFTAPFFTNHQQNTIIDVYKMDWKTKFFAFLANPAVASILFLGLVVGFYMEMSTPGFGLAGTVATTCLFLLILSSYGLELANWLELILLVTGLLIILVELFILPTFGLLGIVGILFFLAGLFGMLLPGLDSISFDYDSNTLNAAGEAVFKRLAWLCGALVASCLLIAYLSSYVTPSFRGFRKFVLTGHEQEGYKASDLERPKKGSLGQVVATLRPAGKVVIEDKLYDAMSQGAFIEKGEQIVVKSVDENTLIVIKKEV